MPGAEADEVARQLESRMRGKLSQDRDLLYAIAVRGGKEAARSVVEYIKRTGNPRADPAAPPPAPRRRR